MPPPIRCLYAYSPADRPNCQLLAAVAYGTISLCTACKERRSTLGKGQASRQLPVREPDPLNLLAEAYTQVVTATEQLNSAVIRARQHHATWTAIATVLGITRQAAQQRFARP